MHGLLAFTASVEAYVYDDTHLLSPPFASARRSSSSCSFPPPQPAIRIAQLSPPWNGKASDRVHRSAASAHTRQHHRTRSRGTVSAPDTISLPWKWWLCRDHTQSRPFYLDLMSESPLRPAQALERYVASAFPRLRAPDPDSIETFMSDKSVLNRSTGTWAQPSSSSWQNAMLKSFEHLNLAGHACFGGNTVGCWLLLAIAKQAAVTNITIVTVCFGIRLGVGPCRVRLPGLKTPRTGLL